MKLWKHQQTALEIAKNRFALFFDTGCGKSRTALELFNKSPHRTAVIIAPLNVCRNWQNEIEQFSKVKKIFLVAGQSKNKKLRILNEFVNCQTSSILIINTESLRSKDYTSLLKKVRLRFFIIDESHLFKSHNSIQTKSLIELVGLQSPEYLYLLTGSPAPQGEIDLWSSLYLLNKTRLPFFVWRKVHFSDLNAYRKGTTSYFPKYVVSNKGKLEINKALLDCSLSVNKNEAIDLPEYLQTNIYCELTPSQRRQYDSMLNTLFSVDDKGERLNAKNVLSRTMRLQQIVGGLTTAEKAANTRLHALESAIEQTNGKQFIVWTIFKNTYNDIAKLLEGLKISYRFLTGEYSAEDRFQSIEMFQAGRIRCLIAHPRAGGVGVNLTAAAYSIYYTKSFNLVDDIQSEARNYRGGSIDRHNRVTRIDIVAQDTIDEQINKALRSKRSVQEFILDITNLHNKENNYGDTGNERCTTSAIS